MISGKTERIIRPGAMAMKGLFSRMRRNSKDFWLPPVHKAIPVDRLWLIYGDCFMYGWQLSKLLIWLSGHTLRESCQEFSIVLCFGHLLQECLHRLKAALIAQRREHTTHGDYRPVGLVVIEQLLAGRTGECDIDSREGTAFGQLAVQHQFHVARTFKLLVDHVVHATASIYERGGDDRQAAALLDLTCSSKEAL